MRITKATLLLSLHASVALASTGDLQAEFGNLVDGVGRVNRDVLHKSALRFGNAVSHQNKAVVNSLNDMGIDMDIPIDDFERTVNFKSSEELKDMLDPLSPNFDSRMYFDYPVFVMEDTKLIKFIEETFLDQGAIVDMESVEGNRETYDDDEEMLFNIDTEDLLELISETNPKMNFQQIIPEVSPDSVTDKVFWNGK